MLERLPGLADRDLNFGAYVLTAARHASYDAIARRRRATPTGDIPESAVPVGTGGDDPDRPEHHALLEAHQEEIRAANEGLPARQREALALRELEGLSYDEVAEIMGMNRNSVAQLISRARINLRDGLRRTALGSVAGASPLCEQALPLLALRQDDALDDAASATWLLEHLSDCATCRVRVSAMEEAGVAYRLWLPLVPVLWLRGAAIAKAAERVGRRLERRRRRAGGAPRPAPGGHRRRHRGAGRGRAPRGRARRRAAPRVGRPHRRSRRPAPVRSAAPIATPAEKAPAHHRRRRAPRADAGARARRDAGRRPAGRRPGSARRRSNTPRRPPRGSAAKPVQAGARRSRRPSPRPAAPEVVVPDPPPGDVDPDSSVPGCPNDPRCVPPPPPPPVCSTCTTDRAEPSTTLHKGV